MPTYSYACEACGKSFEIEQRISADPIKKCVLCGKAKARRQITSGNFILKGGGWYSDGYGASRGGGSTWLLTIARSRSLDRLRALRRSREEAGLDGVVESQAEPGWATPLDPGTVTELNEQGRLIRDALAELPDEQREALQMGYFEGLSQSEIAERTGIPLGTIKTRMRLALRKLREKLGVLREDA